MAVSSVLRFEDRAAPRFVIFIMYISAAFVNAGFCFCGETEKVPRRKAGHPIFDFFRAAYFSSISPSAVLRM
jgi:hypothetical protein